MNDLELMELAAKAAGYKIEWVRNSGCFYRCEEEIGREEWNPLDDDGDAFRLAAKLHTSIEYGLITVAAYKGYSNLENLIGAWSYEKHDHAQVARRAVVLAAAEIGKSMP